MIQKTPKGNRIHIGVFGRTNSGKSSLINAIAGQEVSVVSSHGGTTTDPVYKPMELYPIGPVIFIDTAGFDDETNLGQLREDRTQKVLNETDVAILLFDQVELNKEEKWIRLFNDAGIPVIFAISKTDLCAREALADLVESKFGKRPILLSDRGQVDLVKDELVKVLNPEQSEKTILGDLVEAGNTVVLVMPQDIQAPKGRLILPQVQTLRELLDKKCVPICTGLENFKSVIGNLKERPHLIITDSQLFKQVRDLKPEGVLLTSFSVLFATQKGDIEEFVRGAKAIDKLKPGDKILIAEACTHAPLEEDIGRVKIPSMIRQKYGDIKVDIYSGQDYPASIEEYSLVIHCGACMFNRKFMLGRIKETRLKNVPITNYGVTIAHLVGILDDVVY